MQNHATFPCLGGAAVIISTAGTVIVSTTGRNNNGVIIIGICAGYDSNSSTTSVDSINWAKTVGIWGDFVAGKSG